MSRNIDTVKTMYEAFARGDIPAILAKLAPDIEWEHDRHGEPMRWYQPRRGRENITGFFETLADFDFLRFEPVAFLEGGGMAVAMIQIELKFKANGRIIKDLEAHLWTFGADGQVTRFRHLVDTKAFADAVAA